MILILVLVGRLKADSIITEASFLEAYPAMNHISAFKISKNLPLYESRLNFVAIEENGKVKIYPILTELTKTYLSDWLYFSTLKFLDTEQFNNDIQNIANLQKSLQNSTDPINIFRSIMCNFQSDDVNKCMAEKKGTLLDSELNSFFMAVVNIAIEGKKSIGKVSTEFILKDTYLKNTHSELVKLFSENDTVKYLFDKILSITIDYLWDKGLGKEQIAKKLYSGFMGALTFYAEVANGVINITSTLWATEKTTDALTKKEIKIYISEFIRDYVFKYNMNIYRMAEDAEIVSCITNKKQCQKIPGRYRESRDIIPTDFFQLFVTYAVVNNFIDDINLNISKNMYYMFEAAQEALRLIENFGDGGNQKVFFDIWKDGTVYISPNSYSLQQLYWMPTKEINKEIYRCMPPWMVNGLRINSMLEGSCNIRKYNPFYDDKYFHRLVAERFDRYSYQRHVSVKVKKSKIDRSNIKNLYKSDYYKLTFEKVINYNAFLNDDGKIYKKIAKKFTVAFPNIEFTNTSDYVTNLLDKYLKKGIIDYEPNLGEKLLNFITAKELQVIFKRFTNLNKRFFINRIYLDQKFNSFMWTSPIKQKTFFEFLVKLLNIDTSEYYSTKYSNLYSNVFKLNDCRNTTLEGCALKMEGIYNNLDPNKYLTLFNVLVALENIEKTYKRIY